MEKTPAKAGVEKDAVSAEKPVQRPTPKSKVIDWKEVVKVKNITTRVVNSEFGKIEPGTEGKMSRLNADRMQRYVEIVSD